MSDIQDQTTVKLTEAARAPIVKIPKPGFDVTVQVQVPAGEQYDESIISYLGAKYQDMGTVSLVSLTVVFVTTDAKQEGLVAFKSSTATTEDQLIGKRDSFWHMSNSENYGTKHKVVIIPDNRLSAQIHPIPSDRSVMYLFAKCGTKGKLFLHFDLHIEGFQTDYVTLKA
jgi:hypothetical protein